MNSDTMNNGLEYVYNSRGKLVRLERFDADSTETFLLTPDARLTQEQARQLADAATAPIAFDDDCPPSTPEQLEGFRKYGKASNKLRTDIEHQPQNTD